MTIDKANFCGLSTNSIFMSWLESNFPILAQDLRAHLSRSNSCTENAQKMIGLLATLESNQESFVMLREFLVSKFPGIIVNNIFPNFQPNLLTLPRRVILNGTDCEVQAAKFVADKPLAETIRIGNSVYIEYLTSRLVKYSGSIPESSWLIRQWKSKLSEV